MLATGTIDVQNRTFDIEGVNETETSVSIINGMLRLSYKDPDGKLVQLSKNLNTGDGVVVGDVLGLSPATENGKKGYAQKSNGNDGVARSLTDVDWSDVSKLTSKTFTDDDARTRLAVLLPVVLNNV